MSFYIILLIVCTGIQKVPLFFYLVAAIVTIDRQCLNCAESLFVIYPSYCRLFYFIMLYQHDKQGHSWVKHTKPWVIKDVKIKGKSYLYWVNLQTRKDRIMRYYNWKRNKFQYIHVCFYYVLKCAPVFLSFIAL